MSDYLDSTESLPLTWLDRLIIAGIVLAILAVGAVAATAATLAFSYITSSDLPFICG